MKFFIYKKLSQQTLNEKKNNFLKKNSKNLDFIIETNLKKINDDFHIVDENKVFSPYIESGTAGLIFLLLLHYEKFSNDKYL